MFPSISNHTLHKPRIMDECLAECCLQCIGRSIIGFGILVFESLIVRHGRALQRFFHVPECLCPISRRDPGIRESGLRTVAYVGFLSTSMALLVLAAFLFSRKPAGPNRVACVILLSMSAVFNVVGYIMLLFEKRWLERMPEDYEPLKEESGPEFERRREREVSGYMMDLCGSTFV
ncbi:hypothetical protein F4778DRAFT_473576 [Xylariomycetidae sp. FL2044]|nr:hypothetical protein F4778DRAFT_473576 [Xylariomycetidae sp. FL2044]